MNSAHRIRPTVVPCFLALALLLWGEPAMTAQKDPTQVALTGLEFGGTIGKLLWVTVQTNENTTREDADRYTKLAERVKDQIESGRASSDVVKGGFDLMATVLIYGASVDPEPISLAVMSVAAWGAKKTGDALGNLVIEESQKQAKRILAQGLKNSGLTPSQLRKMKPEQLRAEVGDLRVGGQKLRDVLKDQPESLALLQAHAVDFATDIGVEALSLAQGTAATVSQMQEELTRTNQTLKDYQEEVKGRLTNIESKVSSLGDAIVVTNQKLDVLRKEVQGNTKAIQTLAEISYSGWTTSQKLQAAQGGLFPQLNADQTKALVESLQAEQARERLVAGVQQAAQDFGNLATIASNLGLPKDTVQALQGAQLVATGIAQFATGNYLGALATVTGLAGLGAPDAGAQRHAAVMKYLEQQFAAVHLLSRMA